MRRSVLRAFGAVLLWCASSWGAAAHAAASPPPADPSGLAPIALAGDQPVHLYQRSSYWVDPARRVRLEDIEASSQDIRWNLRRRDQQYSLQDGVLWIRFDAVVPPGEQWYLEVGTGVYGQVQMFHRDRDGRLVMQQAGTQVPVAQWSVPGRLPTFALAKDDPQPVRYWVRVEDERADFSAPVTLFRQDALMQSREQEQLLFGAFFGLAALVALASMANGIAFRDRAFLSFAMFIVLLACSHLGRAGVGAQYLWREWRIWNDTVTALWPGVATAAALWFVKVVTDPARLSRALDLAVWALIAALLGAVALDVLITSKVSMTLVLVLTGLALLAILGMVVWGWLDDTEPHLRLVAWGFLPLLVLALFPLARGFGLMPTNVLTRQGLFLGMALLLPILYYALNLRLIARREDQMRTSALSRNDALTGLPHRQGFIERLDTSLAHARGQRQQLAVLGVRISNLDAIAEEFGREAAEKALVIAGSHLRRVIVDFDMAARVGEREFAVLLEAPMTPEAAASRAQQVVASGLRQVEALPAALTLKFHVTIAMLPHPHMDGAASLRWALEGLDQMPDARKLIYPLAALA
ncbi:sensor domain-containing diguanylate cyclase [Ramlibacter pallidus]|uniref:Diguanylate cyclase n=1 Tax=Ramlibacter pallidus TaxID=2780087 RepID=A0ABR9RZ98_9BURK|nr:7TM diverse intracellular signaling domain-containing protein [Ramlibacter pallidus]MBE7366579.1 diguanylate cyclase [Ramlibacter pallidus]